jgi:hypothetical protein
MTVDNNGERTRQRRRASGPLRAGTLALAGALLLSLAGVAGPAAPAGAASGVTDYAQRGSWLARPSSPNKPVDVFYVYPTVYSKSGPSASNYAAIDDAGMRSKASVAFAAQASAFKPIANIYAPYYRQADAVYTLTAPLAEQNKIIGGPPATDVTAAFDHYITHDNHGRPFILAGHSQGSNVLLFLLSGYLKRHPEVYRRMIAAYAIGYGVTPAFLARNPRLRFARSANDTGVIVSYNTEAPGLTVDNPVVQPGAIAINPVTWKRTQQHAPAALNRGSLLPDAAGDLVRVNHYADAQVDPRRGVVVCSTCDVATYAPGQPGGFPRGVFHQRDYAFYYFNIRHNAANRIRRFLAR